MAQCARRRINPHFDDGVPEGFLNFKSLIYDQLLDLL